MNILNFFFAAQIESSDFYPQLKYSFRYVFWRKKKPGYMFILKNIYHVADIKE